MRTIWLSRLNRLWFDSASFPCDTALAASEMQAFFYLLTRHPNLAVTLFSIVLFPGVFLHEFSHVLAAWLLRVPLRGFSLLPRLSPDGQLQLGYVQTSKTDFLRDALIGAAPFFTGSLVVAYLGLNHLGLNVLFPPLLQANWQALLPQMLALTQQPDFWLWFYLTFAVSSTMIPSAADRRAWWAVAVAWASLPWSPFWPGSSSG